MAFFALVLLCAIFTVGNTKISKEQIDSETSAVFVDIHEQQDGSNDINVFYHLFTLNRDVHVHINTANKISWINVYMPGQTGRPNKLRLTQGAAAALRDMCGPDALSRAKKIKKEIKRRKQKAAQADAEAARLKQHTAYERKSKKKKSKKKSEAAEAKQIIGLLNASGKTEIVSAIAHNSKQSEKTSIETYLKQFYGKKKKTKYPQNSNGEVQFVETMVSFSKHDILEALSLCGMDIIGLTTIYNEVINTKARSEYDYNYYDYYDYGDEVISQGQVNDNAYRFYNMFDVIVMLQMAVFFVCFVGILCLLCMSMSCFVGYIVTNTKTKPSDVSVDPNEPV
eukprot:397046_1